MEAIQVFRRDFCSLENRISNAVSEKLLGTFIGGGDLSAHGVAAEFVLSLDLIQPYLGWDGKVYPQIYVEEITINDHA